MRSFLTRHPLTSYFLLAFGLPVLLRQLAPCHQEVLAQ